MLLDVRMPVMGGWEFARTLRKPRVAVPIVVMTAAESARRWAEEVAATAYLAKPFDIAEVLAVVAPHYRHGRPS